MQLLFVLIIYFFELEIIPYNPILKRVGVSNKYISYGQSSSHKVSFDIKFGPLDFNILNKLIYFFLNIVALWALFFFLVAKSGIRSFV